MTVQIAHGARPRPVAPGRLLLRRRGAVYLPASGRPVPNQDLLAADLSAQLAVRPPARDLGIDVQAPAQPGEAVGVTRP